MFMYLRTHDVKQSVKQSLLHRVIVDLKEPSSQLNVRTAQATEEGRLQLSSQFRLTQGIIPRHSEYIYMYACTYIWLMVLYVHVHTPYTRVKWQGNKMIGAGGLKHGPPQTKIKKKESGDHKIGPFGLK